MSRGGGPLLVREPLRQVEEAGAVFGGEVGELLEQLGGVLDSAFAFAQAVEGFVEVGLAAAGVCRAFA